MWARCRELALWSTFALIAAGCSTDNSAVPGTVRVVGEPAMRPSEGRLVVLGIDGLPPGLLRAAVDDGLLPNFERLVGEGALGVVDVAPAGLPPLSPRIWTTFATGQLPELHGLKGFVYREADGSEVLYDSGKRRVPAIWNIATALGRRVGVVNWWTTSPAEPVNGFIVSDLFSDVAMARLANRLGAALEYDDGHVVYPEALMPALRTISAVDRTIGISPKNAEEVDSNVFEIAQVALQEHPVEILLVYTRAFDELAHMAWHTHETRPGEEVGTDLVMEFLQRYDWLLGRFLRSIGPRDHLMLLSDHGFERYADLDKGGGTHESPPTAKALFFVKGPRIRVGVDLVEPLDVRDVLPTMLELAGLPAAKTMPGHVAAEPFLEDQRTFLPRLDAYELERPQQSDDAPAKSVGDDAMKERLRALGYLEDVHDGK